MTIFCAMTISAHASSPTGLGTTILTHRSVHMINEYSSFTPRHTPYGLAFFAHSTSFSEGLSKWTQELVHAWEGKCTTCSTFVQYTLHSALYRYKPDSLTWFTRFHTFPPTPTRATTEGICDIRTANTPSHVTPHSASATFETHLHSAQPTHHSVLSPHSPESSLRPTP